MDSKRSVLFLAGVVLSSIHSTAAHAGTGLGVSETPFVDCNENGVPDEIDLREAIQFHASREEFSTSRAHSLVARDLDGDARPEVLLHNVEGVFIFRIEDDGALRLEHTIEISAESDGLTVQDIDNDGFLDVAVAKALEGVLIAFGAEDGSFSERLEIPGEVNSGSYAVIDFDGDGDLDFVASPRDGVLLTVFEHSSPREFVSVGTMATDDIPQDVTVADFDSDGNFDLAIATGNGETGLMTFRYGDGNGGFERVYELAVSSPSEASVFDLDGDGFVDLVTASSDRGEIETHLNNGMGEFQTTDSFTIQSPRSIAFGDLTGDQLPDFIASSSTFLSRGRSFVNLGEGRFADLQDFSVAREPGPATLVDIDGDGDLDWIVATLDQRTADVQVYFNSGDGSFENARRTEIDAAPTRLRALNLDGEEPPEILAMNERDENLVVLRSNDGRSLERIATVALSGRPSDVSVFDIDQDGDDDVLAVATGSVTILENQADNLLASSTFFVENARTVDVIAGDGEFPTLVAVGGLQTTVIRLFEIQEGSVVPAGEISLPHGIDEAVAADTNRDGRTDLVVSLDPSITTLIRNAEGDFEPLGPFEIGMRALRLEAHDLDLDGAPEIIAAGRSEPGGLVFARNDGNGAFNEIIQPIGEIEAGGATAVDLNGDGLLDAVVTDGRGNSVIPIIATGDFTYRRESGWIAGIEPRDLVVVDLQLDGLPDIVTTDATSVSVLENKSVHPTSMDRNQNGIPDECEIRFIRCDSNTDGRIDIGDSIWTLFELFHEGDETRCRDSADCNDDGEVSITDAMFTIQYLLRGGMAPPSPIGVCTTDATEDSLSCDLDQVPPRCIAQ